MRTHLSTIRGAGVVIALVGTIVSSARAQESVVSTKARAIEVVMDYRRSFLNDTSHFQACALLHALGKGAGLDALRPEYRAMLDQPTGCDPGSMSARSRGAVAVSTILEADSAISVRVAVSHGEYFHMETYTVVPRAAPQHVSGVLLSAGTYHDVAPPEHP
jgi:hypothetical protein